MLNEYEKNKFDIISKVVSKEITIKEAMDKLNLTERQIYRLKKIYIEHGEKGFIHKSRGKENPNKINNDLKYLKRYNIILVLLYWLVDIC